MQTPDEWLAEFEAKVADLQQRATEFKQAVEDSATTVCSADGTVAVSVASNGALTGLVIQDSAMGKAGAELADEILALVRHARQTAANEVARAFVPLGGDAGVVQRIEVASDEDAPRIPNDDEDFSAHRVYRDESW
ncbi:YbaB/EbfC family nucleoid-associated protein [Actinokineospora inagensis]|uniref:YbaB/EbfC family nucleoid-associated protein n=1 Tax=Actinokineospora inagensis TaxID=103730 RepID=UPI0003F8A3D1|nr:YbaB/EbfC family nucleoid-associated protein [Actinokineospora inagensis]